jgi:hypothetical protein
MHYKIVFELWLGRKLFVALTAHKILPFAIDMIFEVFGRFKTFQAVIVRTCERSLCFMDMVMQIKILFSGRAIVTLVTPEANFCCLM